MKILVLGGEGIPDDRVFVTRRRGGWQPPPEYLAANVAGTVCRIVPGYRLPDLAEREGKKGRSERATG